MVIWHDRIFSLSLYAFLLFVGIMGIYTYLDGGRFHMFSFCLLGLGKRRNEKRCYGTRWAGSIGGASVYP